jgi:hypothetical protein
MVRLRWSGFLAGKERAWPTPRATHCSSRLSVLTAEVSLVGRVTKPCTIMVPPPASANVRDCGKVSAVRAIRSRSGSRGTWLGCRACRVDQRTPRRPNPRREVHLVPQANQLSAVDQFTDVIQRALHEHDLVQIAPPDRVSKIPPDLPWIGSRPEQPRRKTNTALKRSSKLVKRMRHRHVPHPARTPATRSRVAAHTCHGAANRRNVLPHPLAVRSPSRPPSEVGAVLSSRCSSGAHEYRPAEAVLLS